MSKLIDADVLVKNMHFQDGINEDGAVYVRLRDVRKSIAEQPEAVVRCKNCRWGKEVCGNIECFADPNIPPEYHGYEWFCPNGERRTE